MKSCEESWFTKKYFRRVAAILVLAAFSATLLYVWIAQTLALPALAEVFAISVIHSFVIGGSCALVLPWVALRGEKWPPRRKIPSIVAVIFLLTTAGCLASNGVLVLLGLQPASAFWQHYFFSWRISIVVSLSFGMGSYFYESLRSQLEETQLKEERARKLAAEARLSSLEARVHPHFLFNTLNSIASLIPEDPKRAEDIVGKLAALLRFSLDAHQRALVPLEQELKIVRDYLEIEKARYADRLRYTIEAEAPSVQVPPLSIQTLVENSIKHVVAPRREGGEVVVTVRTEDGALRITVADSGPGFSLDTVPAGHGIDNLQARLEALYGAGAALAAVCENGFAAVRMTVPA